MSDKGSSPSVGGTLAGGIQDVSAILPVLGTEQCEKHVGSALTGGYLYAAAAPLSIFGSLGIVKAGIGILISSISLSIPDISISFRDYKPTIKYSGQHKWLGGRMLKDAGFEPTGGVAPLISMDKDRFKAETKLIEMLEEKHIDDPEKISINWKSRQWNIMLVTSTVLAAVLSSTPYIFLLELTSWRPSGIHSPWLFPALRIIGSCIATITCQFILQSRVISLMKNRILFMRIQQQLNTTSKEMFNTWLRDPKLKWDPTLPAEKCICSLEQYISSVASLAQNVDNTQIKTDQTGSQLDNTPSTKSSLDHSPHIIVPITIPFENHTFDLNDLHRLQEDQFPTPVRDTVFITLSWIFLALSLPTTVAGYIGCFTLVNATPKSGNGALAWVGLEASLSILRIIIWAMNPSFDEETEVSLGLKLSEHQPMVTTSDYNPHITNFGHEKRKPFTLIPERDFLEWITPFTGPLDRFQKEDNIALYFTWTTNDDISELSGQNEEFSNPETTCLLMTLLDIRMNVGVTILPISKSFYYFDVLVAYNDISRKMEANIQSQKTNVHPWKENDNILFNSLIEYYKSIIGSFSRRVTSLIGTVIHQLMLH